MSPVWTKRKDTYIVQHDGHEGLIETSFTSHGRTFHVYLDGKPIGASYGDLEWAQRHFFMTIQKES